VAVLGGISVGEGARHLEMLECNQKLGYIYFYIASFSIFDDH
jgi:hypothetical protein